MESPAAREGSARAAAPARMTLRRRERIRRTSEFDRVFREGARFGRGEIVFRFLPSGLPHPRLGIAAGRALGGSVERNCVKRWIREAFRRAKGRIERPLDIVVVARRGEHSPAGIARAFEALLRHLAERGSRRRGR